MEAGNRCFDQRVPEEINRVIVDHIADMNLTYSDIAREMLLREGLPPDRVVKTGSQMFEILTHFAPQIAASDVLQRRDLSRSAERRVGKECVSPCISRWAPKHYKKKKLDNAKGQQHAITQTTTR